MKEIIIKNVDEKVYEHTCASGLKVYIWTYPFCEETNLTLTVKYGSIHTKFKVDGKEISVPNGIAHFLEHIKFNEKKDVSAHEWFNKIGSYVNAYTTYDHTCYEVICSQNIEDNLKHLLKFVYNPYFTKGLIAKEKPIIIEEASMSLDNPYNVGYKELLKNLYFNNNKKYLVTGEKEDIKSITYDDVINVFDNFYHPENMFLIVTGNVNPYEIAKVCDKFFEKSQINEYSNPKVITEKEPDKVHKDCKKINVNVTKENLMLAFKVPRKNFNLSQIETKLFTNILLYTNFGSISLLKETLLNEKLIDDLYYSFSYEDDHLVIVFEVSTSYPEEVSKKIKECFNNLEISKETFERRIKCYVAEDILGFEDPMEVNNTIRSNIINYDKVLDNTIDVLKNAKYEQINLFISKLKKYTSSEVILLPKDK